MPKLHTNVPNADSVALAALTWTLGDGDRAARLLAVTGLDPAALRARAAVLAFLEAHEPDLIACADAISERPEALVAARRELER